MEKTIREWEKEYYDDYELEILDPDGFDRTDPQLMTRKFSKDEFGKRMLFCTLIMKKKETKKC